MNFRLQDHSFFRPAVLIFALFTILQLITGSILYVQKIGIGPSGALEYYQGSNAMLAKYPENQDHFRNPATFEGLLKTAVSHCLAYGLFAFLLLHLLRSLLADGAARSGAEWLGVVVYFAAGLDIASGFVIAYGPWWLAFARTAIFAFFVGSTASVAFWILYLVTIHSPARYQWGEDGREVAYPRVSEDLKNPLQNKIPVHHRSEHGRKKEREEKKNI
ncbi:MAG: hypothetical protein KDK37_08680 [Leptospiraceae bacterium]|nr:hypothetical protein [Leptospiraceae bacterium]